MEHHILGYFRYLSSTTTSPAYIIQSDQKVSVEVQYTIDELKMAITDYVRDVDRAILNTVFENTVRHVNKSLDTGGGHFEYYL